MPEQPQGLQAKGQSHNEEWQLGPTQSAKPTHANAVQRQSVPKHPNEISDGKVCRSGAMTGYARATTDSQDRPPRPTLQRNSRKTAEHEEREAGKER